MVKRLEAVASHLPSKQPALLKMIQTWIGPGATLDGAQDIFAKLISARRVKMEGDVVQYALTVARSAPAKKAVAIKGRTS